jgi:protein-S-isoprenylcysteine O-methyltransferase Ste14
MGRTRSSERTTAATRGSEVQKMSIGTILLVLLVLALLGVIPVWPHARSWGYGPSGIVGLLLLIVLVLLLLGRL